MIKRKRMKKMIKRQSGPLGFIGIVGLLLLGCSERAPQQRDLSPLPIPQETLVTDAVPGKPGGIFVKPTIGDVATFNPLIAEDVTSSSAIGLMSGAMVEYDWARETIVPGLAKSWEIAEDQKTFTFHLREGIQWSDGAPFTADDVLFSYQVYYDKRFPNRTRFQITINGQPCKIEKIGLFTVRITAPEMYAPFLLFVAGVSLLPQHKLGAAHRDGTLLKEWSISTAKNHPEELASLGPFVLRAYQPGERILFKRNPYYYKVDRTGNRLPYIEHLIVKIVRDPNASTAAFIHGETDVESIEPGHLPWVEKIAGETPFRIINRGPSTTTNFIWFNLNPGQNADGKPYVVPIKRQWFEQQAFRQAIAYGTNRQGIVDGVLLGRGAVLHSTVTPANRKWYNNAVRQYPYAPQKARQRLLEAGFVYNAAGELFDAAGHPVEFTLISNKENLLRNATATVFKDNMADLGIAVQLQFIDFNTLVMKITDSFEYEACLLGFSGGTGDPAASKDIYASGGRLHQWHPNQEQPERPWEAQIDDLMRRQASTLDVTERKRYFDAVQRILSEQLPLIPMVTSNDYVGIQTRWQNVSAPTMGGLIWNVDSLWKFVSVSP